MGKKPMSSKNRIKMICGAKKLDEDNLYKKAKLLLDVYRDVCWHTTDYADEVKESLFYECGLASEDLTAALVYLENFAPDVSREHFAERIQGLFEVKWMVDIVDAAMRKVRDFPLVGEIYASIITCSYLSGLTYTEAELLEEFGMERSTFYRRKKEAVQVFGLAVWGGHMDEYKQLFLGIEPRQLSIFDQAF